MNAISMFLGLAFLASELLLAWRRNSARAEGAEEKDDGSLKLLWRVIGISITAGVLIAIYRIGPRLPDLPFTWPTLALLPFVSGTAIRWWSIYHLGRFFTVDVAVSDSHRLVNTGPYRWVRHPSYTGLLLQFSGIALALGNILSLLVILVPIFLALHRRIQVEENALIAKLGDDYTKYASGTKRLVPLAY